MKIITYLQDAYELLGPSAVALGNFDGVHIGHQALIKKCVELAKEEGLVSVVFTFQSLPINEIAGKTVIKNILSMDQKTEFISELGVDYMVCLPFDKAMQKMPAERFARHILATGLKCKHAVCGFNFSFGEGGKGTSDDLMAFGAKYGFQTEIVPEVTVQGYTVSSTLVRSFLASGDVQKYSAFTGRNYTINGTAIPGQKLGTRMGFPTANLNLDPKKALPLNGVYVTYTYVNNLKYKSITNVGNKPTVGDFLKNAETHIFNLNEELYGKQLTIEFIDMLRPEEKFDSIEELSKQIAKDCSNAKNYHEELSKSSLQNG